MSVRVVQQERVREASRRQSLRKGLLLVSVLLFPVTLNYLSPYVIMDGASQGIANGSLIAFGLMFVSSLLLGRAWCGWICPGGGLQDMAGQVRDWPTRGGKLDWIKWAIWVPWIVGIVALAISAGGYRAADPLYLTESGISVDAPIRYATYYTVVVVFVALPLVFGRRAGCHYICWMAPFMIVGRWLRNQLAWPSLRLVADASSCGSCRRCSRGCPMSLDVNRMVQRQHMENAECILCGTCVDNCPKGAIRYSFSSGR